MAELTLFLTNTTGSDVLINDIGLVIDTSGTIDAAVQFDYSEICDSDELKTLLNNGTLTANNGSSLSTSEAVDYVTRENVYDARDAHYTKAEMSSSGTATIHWNNVTNAPSFGSPSLLDPASFRVISMNASAPAVTNTGDIYINTTNDNYYKVVTGTLTLIRSVTTGDRVINLSDAVENIFTFDGSWTIVDNPLIDNAALVIDDNGQGNQEQFSYNTLSTHLSSIGSVDFGPHLDGGANKHNASEVNVVSPLSQSDTTTNSPLESVLGSIDDELSDIDSQVINNTGSIGTLNTTVSSHTISISNLESDMTAVENGVNAAQTEINNIETGAGLANDGSYVTPSSTNHIDGATSLADADELLDAQIKINSDDITNLESDMATVQAELNNIDIVNGVVFARDNTRGKLIGPSEKMYFGRKNSIRNTYLRTNNGINSNQSGLRLEKNMTLVGLACEIKDAQTCTFNVRKNGNSSNESSISIASGTGNSLSSINVDFNTNDVIEIYTTAAAGQDPKHGNLVLTFAENNGSL